MSLDRLSDEELEGRVKRMKGPRRLGQGVTDVHVPKQGKAENLIPRVVSKPVRKLVSVLAADIPPELVTWLWPGWIPRSKIAEIIGEPGPGKTLISLTIAAVHSVGGPLPGLAHMPTGKTLLFSAEDDAADTLVPRLIAAGANLAQIKICSYVVTGGSNIEVPPTLPEDIDLIEKEISEFGADLVIIDPLAAFLSANLNANSDQESRQATSPLAAMCARTRTAALTIRHVNKTTGTSAVSRGGGSGAITGAARSSMAAGRHPDIEGEFVLAPVKGNLAARATALTYRIVDANGVARLEWLGECDATADAILAAPRDPDEKSAVDQAKEFLFEQLRGGSVDQAEIQKRAGREGVSVMTLKRAKAALRVRSCKDEFEGPWRWELPGTPIPPSVSPFAATHTNNNNNNGGLREGAQLGSEGGQNSEEAQGP